MKIKSIQSRFTVDFHVQTTVSGSVWNRSCINVEAELCESSVNLLNEEKGECAALPLKTSNDSWIKFVNMNKLNGWISVHSKQLNVLCLKQMSETKQNKICVVYSVN